jgi:hypothetical protein
VPELAHEASYLAASARISSLRSRSMFFLCSLYAGASRAVVVKVSRP